MPVSCSLRLSIAGNSAKLSSPVVRVSTFATWLPLLPLVKFRPSAHVSRMREFLIVELSTLVPQKRQTTCSAQMSSMVMSLTLEKSNTFPGPSIREV